MQYKNLFLMIFSLGLIAAMLTVNLPRVEARAGDLDNTFSSDGKQATNFFGTDEAERVAIQADGKIVVGGTTENNFFCVARYHPNGSPDTSFSSDGKVTVASGGTGGSGTRFAGVAIAADGKIIIAGSFSGSDPIGPFIVLRFTTSGDLDSTFDGDGRAVAFFTEDAAAGDMVLQPDGKIIVAGTVFVNGLDFAAARFLSNGTLDPGFGLGGKQITDFNGNSQDQGLGVALGPGGKVIIGGRTVADIGIVRYNANGNLDTTFNGTGKLVSDLGGAAWATDVKVQPDGKIVVAGLTNPPNEHLLARYNSNGTLDNSFSDDGWLIGSVGGFSEIAIQSDGKIIGVLGSESSTDFTLIRYLTNGTLDPSFGQSGRVVTDMFSNSTDRSYGLALQADGKIVAVGTADGALTQGRNFAVARYLSGGSTLFDFDGDSKTDLSVFRPAAGEWYYNRSSNGVTVGSTFGSSTDKITAADFTGDGKTDIAFWRPSSGTWYVLRSEDSTFYAFPFGSNGDIPAPDDFDGDDRADATVYRPSVSTWFTLRSSNGAVTSTPFGVPTDAPVPSDYDGDGRADVAIWRVGPGQWWILRSSDSQVLAAQFGSSTDKPTPGDFTGDGKSDRAFFRPSTGSWFVLRSEDSSFFAFPFGAIGDKPAPGDFDGDGRFDAAVFRPSNTNWYVNKSSGGVLIQQFGAPTDIPVPASFIP